MKKRYVSCLLLTSVFLVGCSGSKNGNVNSGSIGSGNVMSGIAATGAPISGGAIKVKGSNGQVVTDTTDTDGSYSADVSDLTEPYLVQVISPSGEKYISVASQSSLAQGKKVNVTPLTHTIVANVFGSSDGDELFANFESESAEFTETKLEDEKDALVQKFVDAGLLGDGKVAGADLDLLNGVFVAGSGDGVDGLLDVIDVNTDASAGIEIKLKGESAALITDKVDGTSDPVIVAIDNTKLAETKAQLTVLDELRARLNALATLHSSKVACNGAAVNDGGACDIDTLHDAFAPFFHVAYQEEGNNREAGIWGWFCYVDADGEDEAETRDECLTGFTRFESVSLKDVSLIHYDKDTNVAMISINIYMNGVLGGSEEMPMKLDTDEGKYDLIGNKQTFKYWIETESLHRTDYNKTSNVGQDKYNVNLNFYLEDKKAHTFDGSESLTLTAVSGHQIFPGGASSMPLYIVVAPKYEGLSCTAGLGFSTTAAPYKVFNPSTGEFSYQNYADACAFSSDPCQCSPSLDSFAYFDHDLAQKVTLSEAEIVNMDKVERISMTDGATLEDVFTIKKPLLINQYNAASFIPSFGMTAANFCETVTFDTNLNLSVATGTLSYLGLFHNFSSADGTAWKNEDDKQEFWDSPASSAVYTPSFSDNVTGDVIRQTHLYLSARDDYERQFVRQVNCNEGSMP